MTQKFDLDLSNDGDYYCSIVGKADKSLTPIQVELPLPNGVIEGFYLFVERGNNTANADINYEVFYGASPIVSDTIYVGTDGFMGVNLNISATNNQTAYIVFHVPNGSGICPINGCRLDYSN